jgi:spore germination protein KB
MHNEVTVVANNIITDKQMRSIFLLFWAGSIVATGINSEVKQDTWISILIASMMILPLIALYIRVIKLCPGLNLFEILINVFGGVFGKILSFAFVWYAVHIATGSMEDFTTFVQVSNMPETPKYLTAYFILLLAVWSVKSGPENIGRLSKLVWPIVAIATLLTIIIGARKMDINNLKPVMEADFKSLLSSSFSMSMLPLGEIVLCLSFFSSVSAKSNTSKIFIKSLIFITIFFVATVVRNVLILGVPSALMLYYPSYLSASIISVGDFFTRVEALIGIVAVLTGFIKICVCLYTASLGLSKILNISDRKTMVVPCGLLIITFFSLLYSNTLSWLEWLKVFPIYTIPFQILLPLIMWIGAEVQARIKTSKSASINS